MSKYNERLKERAEQMARQMYDVVLKEDGDDLPTAYEQIPAHERQQAIDKIILPLAEHALQREAEAVRMALQVCEVAVGSIDNYLIDNGYVKPKEDNGTE